MKKFFALLTALVLCAALFTGAALAEDENLASAKGLLDFWYKNKSRDKLTQTAEDYEVPAQLMIDGVAYPLTWSVDTDAIQITPAEDGKYLVDIDEANPKDLVYTLTATVTAPDGSTLDVPYERMVPAAVLDMSYADIVAAAYALDTDAAMTKAQRLFGKVISIDTAWSDEYQNITVTIQVGELADQPIQCFRLTGEGAKDLKEGDEITVEGILKNYQGTVEFDKGCVLVGFGEIISQAATLDAAYALEDGAALTKPSVLKGVISSIDTAWSDEYQNITVTIVCDGKDEQPIQCYRLTGEGAKELAERMRRCASGEPVDALPEVCESADALVAGDWVLSASIGRALALDCGIEAAPIGLFGRTGVPEAARTPDDEESIEATVRGAGLIVSDPLLCALAPGARRVEIAASEPLRLFGNTAGDVHQHRFGQRNHLARRVCHRHLLHR